MSEISEIKRKLQEIYNITGIPIGLISKNSNFTHIFPKDSLTEYSSVHTEEVKKMIYGMHAKVGQPLINHLFNGCYYSLLQVNQDVFIQIGPAPKHEINFTTYISDYSKEYPSYVVAEHIKLIKGTPKVDLGYFVHVIQIATNYICNTSITRENIIFAPGIQQNKLAYSKESLNRTVSTVGHYAFDSDLYYHIRYGDIKRLYEDQNSISNLSSYYYLENDIVFLRMAAIFYGSICSHYAVLGGLDINIVREHFAKFIIECFDYATPNDFKLAIPRFARLLCLEVHDKHQEIYTSGLIKECTDYISANLYTHISLTDLENITRSSRKTIYRHFKDCLDTTPSEYIGNKRLEESKRLLSDTNLGIVDIATMLDYSSQSHFTKNFKKKYGLTPLQYRTWHPKE